MSTFDALDQERYKFNRLVPPNGSDFMVESTPAIAVILFFHAFASFFPSRYLPRPGAITNIDLLKRPSVAMVFASYFSVSTSPWSLLLTIFNTLVLFAVMDWPTLRLSKFKKQLPTFGIWCATAVAIVCGRAALGFAFGRGTGWAYPQFFFNDSIHEVSRGTCARFR